MTVIKTHTIHLDQSDVQTALLNYIARQRPNLPVVSEPYFGRCENPWAFTVQLTEEVNE